MTRPDLYDRWYETARGRWIGQRETALILEGLLLRPGDSLLDVGCGTGYFTRRLARQTGGAVVGLDPNEARLSYARAHAEHHERYVAGRAEDLPFADRSFDCVVSVTALCFIGDQRKALAELVRVTRRRLVIGVLNRHSLLFLWKGRKGGSGGYAGAQWHTAGELRRLLASAQVNDVTLRTAILAPGSSVWARALERWWPQGLPAGGFLAAAGSPPRVPTCVVPGGTPTADV